MATLKQQRAAKLVVNGRSMKEAMIKAGYSENTAVAPTKLTKSKAWAELLEKELPDSKLLKVHNEGLEATKTVSAVNTGKDASAATADFIDVPDIPTRLRAVELGYRVKGKLNVVGGVNINEAKILVMPTQLITKYGISQNTSDSGK